MTKPTGKRGWPKGRRVPPDVIAKIKATWQSKQAERLATRVDDPAVRVCKHCRTEQAIGQFSAYLVARTGETRRRLKCKSCCRVEQATRYATNPETRDRMKLTARVYHHRVTYGLSLDEVAAMRARQKGRCLICRECKPLCVDHNHTTKKVRGLLCHSCNFGIGHLQDSPPLCSSAGDYLERDQNGPHWQFVCWLRDFLESGSLSPCGSLPGEQSDLIRTRLSAAMRTT